MEYMEGSDNVHQFWCPERNIINEEKRCLWKCVDKNICYWPRGVYVGCFSKVIGGPREDSTESE